jgi:protein TonB
LTSITINAQEVAKIQADSLSVYEDSAVEVKPSFPGGEEKLKLYIKKNYRLPRAEGQIGELGSMLVSFVVETDGRLTNFQGLGSSSAVQSSFQNLLQGSSRWQPGMNNNIAVRTQYTLPFSFVLSSTSKKSTARQPFGGKKKVKKRKVW